MMVLSEGNKIRRYAEVRERMTALLQVEDDYIAKLATFCCELHHSFEYFHWTGFYRVVRDGLLKVGPYQGGHGCTTIPFSRGVCGQAARERKTQLIFDVHKIPHHIACSSSTKSEIVVPVFDQQGVLTAVLDIDSDLSSAFDLTDQNELEELVKLLT